MLKKHRKRIAKSLESVEPIEAMVGLVKQNNVDSSRTLCDCCTRPAVMFTMRGHYCLQHSVEPDESLKSFIPDSTDTK